MNPLLKIRKKQIKSFATKKQQNGTNKKTSKQKQVMSRRLHYKSRAGGAGVFKKKDGASYAPRPTVPLPKTSVIREQKKDPILEIENLQKKLRQFEELAGGKQYFLSERKRLKEQIQQILRNNWCDSFFELIGKRIHALREQIDNLQYYSGLRPSLRKQAVVEEKNLASHLLPCWRNKENINNNKFRCFLLCRRLLLFPGALR